MEERLNRIEEKLDRIVESQGAMQGDIREHIRRTAIAEDNIEKLSKAMAPVQEHVAFVRGLGKLLTILGTLIGGLAAIWQTFLGGK